MLNFVTLQGRPLRLLAILAMPVFALNGVGLRGQPPRLLYRAVAAVAWIYFLYVSLSLLGGGWARAASTGRTRARRTCSPSAWPTWCRCARTPPAATRS